MSRTLELPYGAVPLEPATVSNVNLDEFYRFALLLCGQAKTAEQVLATALSEMQAQLGQLRSTGSRQAWLVARIRQECKRLAPATVESGPAAGLVRLPNDGSAEAAPLLAIEAYLFARRFSTLPEPGRSALALFYLELFPMAEIPGLLNLSWDRFCEALHSTRSSLRAVIQQMRTQEALPP